jgi:predicted aspartyl protease
MLARLNSGADYVALPEDLAKEIEPEFLRVDEVILADGTKRKEKIFKVTARIIDNKGKTRKCTTEAIVSKRAYPLLSVDAMKKLRIIPDVIKGKVIFK